MNCTRCNSERTLRVSGKTSDRCFAAADHLGIDGCGYVPDCIGESGDYIVFEVCCECGQMHAEGEAFSVTDADLRTQIGGM